MGEAAAAAAAGGGCCEREIDGGIIRNRHRAGAARGQTSALIYSAGGPQHPQDQLHSPPQRRPQGHVTQARAERRAHTH